MPKFMNTVREVIDDPFGFEVAVEISQGLRPALANCGR